MASYLRRQALLTALRVERPLYDYNAFDRFFINNSHRLTQWVRSTFHSDARLAKAIIRRSEAFVALDDATLFEQCRRQSQQLRSKPLTTESIVENFALVREVSGRILGMRHHHTQIRASLCLLRGEVAEMATGEGKTLAATLACATAAMAGIPVHVVTVNDYLAERDAEEMEPLYRALGLSLGIVVHDMELPERRAAYHSDITYCSNKELVFDYLKDRIALGDSNTNPRLQQQLFYDQKLYGELLLRGLHFAIVDEADSIFIDESRTPLIISGQEKFGAEEEKLITQAMSLAQKLESQRDFIQHESGGLQLLEVGCKRLLEVARPLGGLWLSRDYRESLVTMALTAYHRYQLDRDYIINDEGEVQIVDPYTGRVTPGRSWGQGLHQMIELKEGVELTKPRETKAEISYQNFFRKYYALSGMTGTGTEVVNEFRGVFRVGCSRIPLLKKSLRKCVSKQVLPTIDEKNRAVVDYVQRINGTGQPVLIGTATVEGSEQLSVLFNARGLSCRVLNARQDKEEAEVIAQAGQYGAITIATGMAGRGTDIKLSPEAKAAGGLHVVITELQDASRIDRQFFGRSARQGDPGCYSLVLSLQDSLLSRVLQPRLRKTLVTFVNTPVWRNWLGYRLLRFCQARLESMHYKQRMNLLKSDVKRQRLLSFAGKSEYSQ